MAHYVYRLTDDHGHFYIGVRSCSCLSVEDTTYKGSGRWPRNRQYERAPLVKEVLAEFLTRTLAEEAEVLLIDMSLDDKRCRNSIKTASDAFKAERCVRTRFGLRLKN